jgi:hypothetical protein
MLNANRLLQQTCYFNERIFEPCEYGTQGIFTYINLNKVPRCNQLEEQETGQVRQTLLVSLVNPYQMSFKDLKFKSYECGTQGILTYIALKDTSN